MGKVFDGIDDHLRDWIGRQRLFFVGTAPLAADGHINVSPKGPIDSLAVLDEHTVAYLDIVGSGAETIAHLRENGRVVVMLCAFDGPPRILRLHGTGTAHVPGAADYHALIEACGFELPAVPESTRAVIHVDVTRVADSCGYGVPLMDYIGEGPHQDLSTGQPPRRRGAGAVRDYQAEKNLVSIDGLPAVDLT